MMIQVGYGEARGSIAAFLFVIGSRNARSSSDPGIKLIKVGGPGLAQMDLPESGPSFSPDALVIPMSAVSIYFPIDSSFLLFCFASILMNVYEP